MVERYDTTAYDSLYSAIITPFKPGGYEVDEEALRSLVRYHLDNDRFADLGGGIIVNPEAGEIFTLDLEERRRTVRTVLDEVGDACNVFAGVYATQHEELLQDAENAADLGVDGFFVMPPAGSMEVTTAIDVVNHPEIWVEHVRSVAEVADLPVIVHPTAPLTSKYGNGLPIETTREVLDQVPSVTGWKMTYSYSGWQKIARYIRSLDRHVGILAAAGSLFHASVAEGYFDGTVSGSYNYALEPMVEHLDLLLDDDLTGAREVWHDQLADLHGYVYDDFTRLHIRYKIAAWLRGLTPHPFMRRPMPDPTREEILRLDELLDESGLSTVSTDERDRVIDELGGGKWPEGAPRAVSAED